MNVLRCKVRVFLRHVLCLLPLLFVSVVPGQAQLFNIYAEPPGMDTIELPPGYILDNTFRFGVNLSAGDSLTFAWLKEIGIDYTYTYGGPSTQEWEELRDSSAWPGFEPYRWPIRANLLRWTYQAAAGIGAIYAPGYVEHSVPDAQALDMFYDNYIGHPYHDTANRRGCDRLGTDPDALLHQETSYVAAGRFDKCDTCTGDRFVARNGSWTNEILQRRDWSTGPIYAMLGYADSSAYFDLSFAVRADTSFNQGLNNPAISNAAPIATIIAWRRDTIGQTLGTGSQKEACQCAFYVPVDTFYITKGQYLNSPDFIRVDKNDDEQDFREYYFPFRFPTDTVLRSSTSDTLALIPLDTTVTVNGVSYSSIPVYGGCIATDGSGNCIEWGAEPYHPNNNNSFGGGAIVGTDNTWRMRYCERLRDTLVARGVYPGVDSLYLHTGIPFNNDFTWEFRTTNLVELDFLMGRISNHSFRLMQRGDLDSLLYAEVQGALNDTMMGDLMVKVALPDEPNDVRFPGSALVASKVQAAILDRNPTDLRGTFVNPKSLAYRYRIHTGDIDSTNVKLTQTLINQTYPISPQLPITYANLDSMSWQANRDYYKMNVKDTIQNGDLIRRRFVMGTNMKDYLFYTRVSQGLANNIIERHRLDADVSRKWFRHLGAVPYPVGGIVQVHGWMDGDPYCDGNGDCKGFSWARAITPEEITVQGWLALNFGLDGGLLFSDFAFCGAEFGVINGLNFDNTTEYDILSRYPDPRFADAGDTLPRMWLGFGTRSAAVSGLITEFREKILPTYSNLDVYGVQSFSLDDAPDMETVPLFGMVKTERAEQYTDSANVPTGLYDTADSTFLQLSVFRPTSRDTVPFQAGAMYFLATNKRMYPIDFQTYSANALALLDSLAIYDTASADDFQTTGFGRIDFRRPVVVLKNSTSVQADSALIEMVGYEGTWSEEVAFGDTVALDWIKPGWGAMYRVTPIPSGVSNYGVAYNNAVRSENTATDADAGYQVTVVERDSAVWVRTYIPGSGWGEEFLVSAAADTARVTGLSRRLAHNILPAVARVRDGEAVLVVWQRLDTNDQGTVEALHIAGKPDSSALANATPLTISSPRTIDRDWMKMAPAVVGFDGGWIIAWGAPTNGIEVAALRNETVPDVTDDRSNISVVRGQQLSYPSRFGLTNVTVPLDSISMYPTLAYVPNEEVLNEGQSNEQHLRWGHLAWQQGADSSESIQSSGPYIMYKKIGVEWRWDSVKPLLKVNQPVEHVSQSLPGCRFYHPSIAADSLRVGVAFESRALLVPRHIPGGGSIGEIKAVTLRFRDSLKADGTSANARRWSSPAYYWGDSSNFYVYPSLTEFPIKPRADLLNTPEGALAWFNQTDGTSQWSYRYGELLPGSLPDGNYPTMMLAPAVVEEPVTQTGVLYRETDSFTRARGWGETGTYYPARMITDETYALDGFRDIFTVLPRTSGIHAHLSIGSRLPVSSTPCNFAVVQAGLAFDHVDGGQRDTFTIVPGTFFSPPENGDTWIEDPDDGSKVVRTEAFPAGTITTTIRRYVGRTSDAVTWLNTFPYDTVMLSQPDVKILTELVRVTDDVVLWQDDTISVRDMTTDALAEVMTVPTDAVTPSGTMVYTRIRAVPTLDVEYLLSAGFQFYEDNTAWITSPKRSSPWQIEQQSGNEAGESILRVQIIPNPAKDRADVRVTVQNPGTVTVSVWSLLGEQLAELPPITAETAGIYTVAVDLSNVRPGTYLVKAETNGTIATSRIHVE
ncbi:MAG: T9SS type A sorting domain-containing protein [Candidatus Kapaibacterium sp.]|nr:T9SS type A sorting domain-containing protein [Ignavibacteria bacterium]